MKPMALYKLLQDHAAVINKIVVDLYNGDIEAPAAETQANEKLEQTLAAMKEV